MGYLEDGRLMICSVWESFFCQLQHGNGVVCVICAVEELTANISQLIHDISIVYEHQIVIICVSIS